MSERGIVTLGVVMLIALGMGIGYLAAKVEDHPAECHRGGIDVRCLFVEEP